MLIQQQTDHQIVMLLITVIRAVADLPAHRAWSHNPPGALSNPVRPPLFCTYMLSLVSIGPKQLHKNMTGGFLG
jgi:hypothetical protein